MSALAAAKTCSFVRGTKAMTVAPRSNARKVMYVLVFNLRLTHSVFYMDGWFLAGMVGYIEADGRTDGRG